MTSNAVHYCKKKNIGVELKPSQLAIQSAAHKTEVEKQGDLKNSQEH